MQTFNFIPAIKFDSIFEGLSPITFFGASGYFYLLNGIYYIMYDGCHVATKGLNTVYNPNAAKLPKGFKSAVKSL